MTTDSAKNETDIQGSRDGDVIDARGSQGFVNKPSGPVTQKFVNIQTLTIILPNGEKVTIPFLAPPLPHWQLVGRDEILGDLKKRLFAGGNLALSALNGLPGVGKTALAVALAHDAELLAHFSDGVLWAGLGHNPDVLALLGTWATALGFTSDEIAKRTTIKERRELLKAAIGQKKMLLVADDAWQSEAGLAFRVGGPNCAHLLTTRQPGIAFDFAGESTTVTELSLAHGLLLLKKLAPAAVAAESEAAEELVKAVDGLPLALILMGRYLQKESRDGQPSRLSTALKRLREVEERVYLEQAPAPPGYYPALPEGVPLSLWAAIVISDEALDDAASRTLYALSVFPPKPNTFSEEAAKTVSAEPVTTLYTLSDYGLLESGKPGRYTLHQTIADYARLERTEKAAEERMVNYFVEYVETHEREYDVLEQETNNVVAALKTAFERDMQTELVQGTNAFGQFLNIRGLYGLAETLFSRAEQTARALNDAAGLVTILPNLGRVAVKQGNYSEAEKFAQEGLVLARQLNNQEKICSLLALQGGVALQRGEFDKAEVYWKEGLAVARQLGQHGQISSFLRNLGAVAGSRGAYEQAKKYLQEGLELARKIKNDELISALLMNWGYVANNRGAYDQAEAYFQESLELAKKIGYRERISELLLNLGVVAGNRQAYNEAEKYFQEGLTVARELALPDGICHMLLNLGDVAVNLGEYEQAKEYLQEGLALARKLGHAFLISGTLVAWGELYLKQHKWELAYGLFDEALEIAKDVDTQELIARALYGLAQVAFGQGKYASARRQAQESLTIFETIGHADALKISEWLAKLPPD